MAIRNAYVCQVKKVKKVKRDKDIYTKKSYALIYVWESIVPYVIMNPCTLFNYPSCYYVDIYILSLFSKLYE